MYAILLRYNHIHPLNPEEIPSLSEDRDNIRLAFLCYLLLFIPLFPVNLVFDLLKPLYILTTQSWVDLEWITFRSDEKLTFVRPYLVKCPYVSSPLFISLLLFVDMNTTDDKNLLR